MAITIANVELTDTFDKWRITTNQALKALREEVVTKEEVFLETVLDSIEAAATPVGSSPQGETYVVSDTVQLTPISLNVPGKIENFKAGQKVRIYGARFNSGIYETLVAPNDPVNNTPTTSAVFSNTPSNFAGHQFEYFVRQFDFASGKISNSSAVLAYTNVNLANFNITNKIAFRLSRSSTSLGLLVYRKISGPAVNSSTYNLIYVLGPKDLSGTTDIDFVDFYDYDYVPWSKKNARNEFTSSSGLIHFPLSSNVPPTGVQNTKFGWVDTEIKFVDTTLRRLTFTTVCRFEPTCVVSHDDTLLVQNAIDERNTLGFKSLVLPTKVYFVKGLVVPDNFSIVGTGSKTTLRKLSWSSSYVTTGNKIIKSTTNVNDFSLSNINIDGNMQNQYLNSEVTDSKANYIIDVQGNTFRYENIKVSNVIGGGIDASQSSSISVVSSFIVDSNLNDRGQYSPTDNTNTGAYSPLDISSSSDVVLTSNIFRNFSGAIEASALTTGSIVGNIIKNCGSGLYIFGSTNLISSPNILMGPANEFLPGPDILNSEYDSINIKLEPGTDFSSANLVYQENGNVVDLSLNGPNRTTVYYRVDRLQKVGGDLESLYGNEILVAGNRPLQPSSVDDPSLGQFKFAINATSVDILLNNYNYTTLKAQNQYHVGIVYRAIAQSYIPSANVVAGSATINNVSRSISANTFGVNSTTDTIKLNNVVTIAPLQRWFEPGQEVWYNLPSTNTAIGGLTANTNYFVSFANNTDIALSLTFNGPNINLTETRTTATAEVHSLNKRLYEVTLENAQSIAVGGTVKFSDHQGNPNFDEREGVIESYNTQSKRCVIAYAPDINITSAGSGGIIGLEKSYVLAKGRIL